MRFRWYFWVAFVLVAGGAAFGLFEWRKSSHYDNSRLLLSLPLDRALKLSIDVDALRAGGLLDSLAGPERSEEPDYRHFIEETGFDFRKDLNAAAASYLNGEIYLAARGQFDWKRLADYARSQKGECSGAACWMPASQPKRYISFHSLRADVLALAVTADQHGDSRIAPASAPRDSTVPASAAPVWLSAPGADFRDLSGLPDGSHILSPLADSQEASFSLRAGEIQLDAACSSPETAAGIVVRFTATADLLRKMLERDKLKPGSSDLASVLTAGRFETRASHALGTWPLPKALIDSLLRGGTK